MVYRFEVPLHLVGQIRLVDHDERYLGGIEQIGNHFQVVAGNAALDMPDYRTDRCSPDTAGCQRRADADWREDRRGETCSKTEAEPLKGRVPSTGLVRLVDFDLA